MFTKRVRMLIFTATLLLFLGACNMPTGAQPTQVGDSDRVGTQAAQTVNAELTLRAGSVTQATDEATTAPGVSTSTWTESAPTLTLTATLVPSQTSTSTPCDRASFVDDVTIQDGTEMDPDESFLKTWRLSNSGSCTWNSSYNLVFDHGDAMSGAASIQLTTGTVAPGQTVDASVSLTAPSTPGTYKGYWKLRNDSGVIFGIGAAANVAFWVEIVVVSEANFSMSFENVHLCGLDDYATVKIVNTGSKFFKSADIRLRDITSDTLLYSFADNTPFYTTNDTCGVGESDADPGNTYYLIASTFGGVSGNTARFRLELCTEDDQGGTCVTKTVDFTLP